jgi:TPR repeat protein
MGIWTRLKAWKDSDGYPERRTEWVKSWDDSQLNDAAIKAADPFIDEANEAAALLDDDPDQAVSLLLDLAKRGSVWSMTHLGWCYLYGEGTPSSLPDAEHWYRLAYEAGSDRGLLGYAWLLHHRGAVDETAAVYAAGAARDWAPALYRSASLSLWRARTVKERLAMMPMLTRAAEAGSPDAQLLLAQYMLRGSFGVRHVLPGIHRAYLWIKAAYAGLEVGEARLRQRKPVHPPKGATLH